MSGTRKALESSHRLPPQSGLESSGMDPSEARWKVSRMKCMGLSMQENRQKWREFCYGFENLGEPGTQTCPKSTGLRCSGEVGVSPLGNQVLLCSLDGGGSFEVHHQRRKVGGFSAAWLDSFRGEVVASSAVRWRRGKLRVSGGPLGVFWVLLCFAFDVGPRIWMYEDYVGLWFMMIYD